MMEALSMNIDELVAFIKTKPDISSFVQRVIERPELFSMRLFGAMKALAVYISVPDHPGREHIRRSYSFESG
ncbi:MAG: hypothetical protein V1761_02125 [bacterium]